MYRADILITDEERWKIEKEKVRAVLRMCGDPEWALKEGELRGKRQLRKEQEKQKGTEQVEKKMSQPYAVLPYIDGITERVQRAFKKYDIAMYVKAGFTIRNAVVSPKDHYNVG